MWTLERLACEGFGRNRQGIRVCAEAREEVEDVDRASMQRIGVVEVASAAGVARLESPFDDVMVPPQTGAVPDWVSLIRWMVMLAEQPSSLSCRRVESTAATE